MSTPYRVGGYVRVPAARLPRFLRELPQHIALTRAEPGCFYFEVTQRKDEPTVFDVREAFVDHDAFLTHQARAAETSWKEATADIERYYIHA